MSSAGLPRATKNNVIGERGHLIDERDRRDFAKAVNLLNATIARIREYIPDANLYIEDANNFNLLTGDSHDERDRARQDRIALDAIVWHSGGGGW